MDRIHIPAGIRVLRRKCVVCGQKKPNTRRCWHFEKDVQHPDGSQSLHPVCRRCDWKLDNKDKVAEQQRRYYADNKDKVAEQQRRYRADNKDKVAERQRRYRAERIAQKYAGIRTVRSVAQQHATLKTQYGQRSVHEALGIEERAS